MALTPQQKQQRQAVISNNKTALKNGGRPTDVRSITSTENPLPGTQGPVSNPTTAAPFQVSSSPMVNLVQGVVDGKIDPTTRETATARAEGEFGRAALTQKDIFGDQTQQVVPGTNTPTFQQYAQQNDKLNAQDLAASRQAVDAANASGAYDLQKFADSAKSSIAGIEASLSGGRNGVMSSGAPAVVQQYKDRISGDIQQASTNYQAAKAQRDSALAKAEQARANGQLDTAKFWEGQIASQEAAMERERQNAETLSQNALSQSLEFSREARYAQQQGFTQGKDMLDFAINNGVALSPTQTIQIANKMGLKPEDVAAYNDEITRVMNLKGIDEATKQAALETAGITLQRLKTGRDDEKVRTIDNLMGLYRSGADPEIISAFKKLAGITDYDDPLTAATLEQTRLENEIRRKQMSGQPVSASEMLEWQKYEDAKNAILNGGSTGSAVVPSGSLEGITVGYQNGELQVNCPPDARFQCGEFVNRAWGLPSAGSQGMGSSIAEKKKTVDTRGFKAGDGQVMPGMAFVMEGGQYGHTGLVKSAPDANGNFKTVEFNANPKSERTKETMSEQIRNVRDVYGFVPPPNAKTIGGKSLETEKVKQQLIASKGLTKQQRADLIELIDTQGIEGAKQWAYSNRLNQTQRNVLDEYSNATAAMSNVVSQLNSTNVKFGPYKALSESSKPWLDIQRDQKYVELRSLIELGQAQVRKGFFGTAVTDTEAKSAQNFLITDNDDLETIKTKTKQLARFLEFANDATLARAIGIERPKLSDYLDRDKAKAGDTSFSNAFLNAVKDQSPTVTDEQIFNKYQNIQALPENITKFGYE